MVWDGYVGKTVFIEDNNNRTYHGVVQEIIDIGNGILFLSFIYVDKFGNKRWVTLRVSEIIKIKEEL